jgi:hypothetical protein
VAFDRDYWLTKLSGWNEPKTFDGLVKACSQALGPFEAMIRHGTGFWRDAWIASQFAQHARCEQVRLLHPEPAPDFAVVLDGVEHRFEATEALGIQRRRGDEYRSDLAALERGESVVHPHPVEDWLNPQRAFDMLKTAADRKAGKAYADSCGLVIYLNDSDYGSDAERIRETFGRATISAGLAFQSVDVLWDSQVYRVWESGYKSLIPRLGQAILAKP